MYNFIRDHKKTVALIVLAIILACIISAVMTRKSVSYSSIKIFDNIALNEVHQDLSFDYISSCSYGESISILSIINSCAGDIYKIVNEINSTIDFASALSDAHGKAGTLIIPTNSLGISCGDIGMYEWAKHYKVCFNQWECSEGNVVIVLGDFILQYTFHLGYKFGGDITLYKQ